MKITNKHNLPQPIVDALMADNYSRGDSNRSVTQLIDSPQKRILCSEHDDLIEEDASELVWRVFGSAVHQMFEGHGGNGYTPEERLYAEVDGWKISGAIDVQYDVDGTFCDVIDYKTTSVWSVIYGKKEWEYQLNFYAWLVETCKIHTKVRKLQVVAILRDWNQREADKGGSYPQAPIVVIDVPLWSPDDRKYYVYGRIKVHQDAEFERLTGGELPPCTDEERWMRPSTYAVKKGKNKRAIRVYDEKSDAEKHVAEADPKLKLWIEDRRGEPVRCARGYCKAADWCHQYQTELETEGENDG